MVITAASFQGSKSLLQYSGQTGVSASFYVYTGDGAVTLGDATASATFAGSMPATTALGSFSIPLSTSLIQSRLGTYAGVRVLKSSGERLWISSLENGASTQPTLNLTYTHRPAGNPESYSVDEDQVLNVATGGVLANDTDADNDPLTATLLAGPGHGTIVLKLDGTFQDTPAPNFHGVDSFRYAANDGLVNSASVTVTITVNAINGTRSRRVTGFQPRPRI